VPRPSLPTAVDVCFACLLLPSPASRTFETIECTPGPSGSPPSRLSRDQRRKQPAPRSELSTASGRGTRAAGRLACGAACGEYRELLLDALPSTLGALRRLLVARQHELLEDVSAVATGVFKDRHGKPISILRFDVTAFLFQFPRRGGKTPRSSEARDSGNAWQHQEPDH